MKLDRRRALALLGLGAAASPAAAQAGRRGQFAHGVASGDPALDGAVLWTRWSPIDRSAAPIRVNWWVAPLGGDAAKPLNRGSFETSLERDWTVKPVVTGLKPGADYQYGFEAAGTKSPVGRFRTLPKETEDVVFAVASCALHPGGLFNSYEAISKLDRLDAVIHLGDYIYEYGSDGYGAETGRKLGRVAQPPHEILTLADYRQRHAQYRSDPDLQAAHARAAWIMVWDDHEVANDGWLHGAQNHNPDKNEGDWSARKANGLKAYYEWMPIREPQPGRSAEMIARNFRFGDIATLHMAETRLTARSKQLSYETDLLGQGGQPDIEGFRAKLTAADRRLMSDDQIAGVGQAMTQSVKDGVAWQVFGNQILMARINGPNMVQALGAEQAQAMVGQADAASRARLERLVRLFSATPTPYNLDAWDGYPAERERVYAAFKAAGARPIVLAGDSHAAWVNELKDASGARVGAEFGATAISSPSLGDAVGGMDIGSIFAAQNEEVVFSDQSGKGFTLLRLTKSDVTGELMAMSTVEAKPYEVRTVKRFRVTREGDGLSAPTEA